MDERTSMITLFLVLHIIGGHVGMLLILITIFSSRQVKRPATFINFCLTWLLFSISYVLLLYSGQMNNPNPPQRLCLVQAAMTYGAAPMTSVSSFFFLLHILLVLRRNIDQRPRTESRWQKPGVIAMVAFPYIVFLGIFVAVMIYGSKYPQEVQRETFYCHIATRSVAMIPPAATCIAVVACIVVEVVIAITLYRNWRTFGGTTEETPNRKSLRILIRALLFTACAVVSILICAADLANVQSMAPGLAIAFLPAAAFLFFGTQTDMLRAWHIFGRPLDSRPFQRDRNSNVSTINTDKRVNSLGADSAV